MEPKLLKSTADYENAIKELESIGDIPSFEEDANLIGRFELFSKLIDDYEKEHFPIAHGDPIEIVKLKMDSLGLKPKDLQPFIGSKGTVSEVLNKKRGLSKNMIRKLARALNLDQEILNTEYDLMPNENANAIFGFAFSKQTNISIKAFKHVVQKRGMLLNVCP